MADVRISIGGRDFDVSCQPGEEHFLRAAAKLLDNEASTLIGQMGRLPESRMLLMAALMLADRTAGLPGLPDSAYHHDGQLTKREVRAITLAALAPLPGELLWDVGAGCGSIGIEWLRSHPSCQEIGRASCRERVSPRV